LARLEAAIRDFEHKEAAGAALERGAQIAEAGCAGLLPSFDLHWLHPGGYLAERAEGEWNAAVYRIPANHDEVSRVRIISARLLYLRTGREVPLAQLRDLIDFAHLPF